MSFENLLLPSGRQESAELVLAECCGSIGFSLSKTKTYRTGLQILWPQDCGMQPNYTISLRKLYLQKLRKISTGKAGCEDRTKRALPTTVTPEQRTDHYWKG